MPQDELVEVREALLTARRGRGADANPFMWREFCVDGVFLSCLQNSFFVHTVQV